jgi:hypothetical protein
LKSQAEVVRQQEERLRQSEDLIKDLKSSSRQAELVSHNKDEKLQHLEAQTKTFQAKLEEAQEQLKRNGQTVRHLNKELNDTRVGRNHSVAQHMAYDSAHTFTPSFNYGHIPKYDPSSPLPLQPGPFSAKPIPSLSGTIRTDFGPSPKLPTEHKFFGEAQSSFPSYSHAPALPLQSKFLSRPEPAPEMVPPRPSLHPPILLYLA